MTGWLRSSRRKSPTWIPFFLLSYSDGGRRPPSIRTRPTAHFVPPSPRPRSPPPPCERRAGRCSPTRGLLFLLLWLVSSDLSLTVVLHRPVVGAQRGKPRHSRWYATPPQLLGHNSESRVTLGGTSHRHSCFRHNWESRITLGGESHRHSCRAQLGKLLLVAHVLDACCRAHVLDATQFCLSPPYCCRCIAAALPLHCRYTAATLLPLLPCCTHCRRHCHHLNHSHCAASSRSERMLPLFVLCCLPQFRWLLRQLCLAPLACSLATSSICHVAPFIACNC